MRIPVQAFHDTDWIDGSTALFNSPLDEKTKDVCPFNLDLNVRGRVHRKPTHTDKYLAFSTLTVIIGHRKPPPSYTSLNLNSLFLLSRFYLVLNEGLNSNH